MNEARVTEADLTRNDRCAAEQTACSLRRQNMAIALGVELLNNSEARVINVVVAVLAVRDR
jgi:hypothetical protein